MFNVTSKLSIFIKYKEPIRKESSFMLMLT